MLIHCVSNSKSYKFTVKSTCSDTDYDYNLAQLITALKEYLLYFSDSRMTSHEKAGETSVMLAAHLILHTHLSVDATLVQHITAQIHLYCKTVHYNKHAMIDEVENTL